MDQELSENIWFVWSRTCYKGEKLRCHACDTRTTDGHWKVEQYSAEAESAILMMLMMGSETACPSLLPGEEGSDTEQMRSRRGCNILLRDARGDGDDDNDESGDGGDDSDGGEHGDEEKYLF